MPCIGRFALGAGRGYNLEVIARLSIHLSHRVLPVAQVHP
jgi:hypothetical protein